MDLDDKIEFRISREMKRELQDKNIRYSDICRRALEGALGRSESIASLMGDEEARFHDWSDSFIRLYQFVDRKLNERDKLTIAETSKLEEIWRTIEYRMGSRDQLMEEIPELAGLTFEDCFDWPKLFAIIDKFPKLLKRKVGMVQVREGILYREVRKGNFGSMEAARAKMKAELDLRASKAQEELQARVQSKEFRKEYLVRQEELRLEAERARSKEFQEAAKAAYDHAAK